MNDEPELPEIDEETLIVDIQQLKALDSRVRMRILALCKRPMSVSAMAERLSVPKTTLYYHVDLLEKAGFIQVVHVSKSGARLERLFRVTGKAITYDNDRADRFGDSGGAARAMVSIVIEPTRAEAEAALAERLEGGTNVFYLGRDQATLTDSDAEELREALGSFVREWFIGRDAGDDPSARPYSFTYALARTDPS